MANVIYGDFQVKRTLHADRRANQGLSAESITAVRSTDANDYSWLNITTDDTVANFVVLPNTTTLNNGWSIVVMAQGSNAVNVKTYHATTPVLLKNILVNRAYRFTLLDNTTGTSTGTWHVDFLEEADLVPAERYVAGFNATTSWGTAAGGYYSFVVTQATHARGTSPVINALAGAAAPFTHVGLDSISVASNGDITIKVPELPDLRFAGELIII